jgi:flagellar biosynthesis protein FlhG
MIGQAQRVSELERLKGKRSFTTSGKIITFTSGKGGTGKTFAALNTAYSLAQMGARTLLIDFDTNLSNINIFLNYHPKTTVSDFLQKKQLFEEIIIKRDVNFDIVFGDSGKAEYPEMNEKLVDELMRGIEKVEQNYDFIIIDTASGANVGIISLLCRSEINIIITTPEPTAVMDAYVIIKLLKVNGYNKEKYVVFNKCLSEEAGALAYNNLTNASTHFLGESIDLLGTISYDQEVMHSIITQELICKTNPYSETVRQLQNLSEKILKFKQLVNINQALAG